MDEHHKIIAKVAWEGNSLEIIRSFPDGVREDLGAELRRLQKGERPINSRPMKSIGQGVYEIKEQDQHGWYRVIYLSKIRDTIYVLHCFRKQSRKTSQLDFTLASNRLKIVRARIKEESER